MVEALTPPVIMIKSPGMGGTLGKRDVRLVGFRPMPPWLRSLPSKTRSTVSYCPHTRSDPLTPPLVGLTILTAVVVFMGEGAKKALVLVAARARIRAKDFIIVIVVLVYVVD